MSITIIIPGFNRTVYLDTVFKSIQSQTAISKVSKIIFSESGTSDDSKLVCEKYADLPIHYIKQKKSLSFTEHWYWLIEHVETEYTAMIHDDDWWYPTHLECALKALQNKNISSYFSNFVLSQDRLMQGGYFHFPHLHSIFMSDNTMFDKIYQFKHIAALSYIFTPFHTSAMVARSEALKYAGQKGLVNAHAWYADRIIYPFLALSGNIYFNYQILCGIRIHKNQHSNDINNTEKYAIYKQGSEKILKLGIENDVNIIDIWEQIKEHVSEKKWNEIANCYRAHFGCFAKSKLFSTIEPKISIFEGARNIVKNCIPLGIIKYLRRKNLI